MDVLEGAHDGRAVAVFEFPTLEAIHEFWDSPAYQDIKRLREGVADLDIWAVAGPDPSAP